MLLFCLLLLLFLFVFDGIVLNFGSGHDKKYERVEKKER